MTLVELIKDWYASGEAIPPAGYELGDDVSQVSYDTVGERRWGNDVEIVYKRHDEYAMVEDVEPATEMQEWGAYGAPEVFAVKPVEETIVVTKYVKI